MAVANLVHGVPIRIRAGKSLLFLYWRNALLERSADWIAGQRQE
jgi:hypothetical protein